MTEFWHAGLPGTAAAGIFCMRVVMPNKTRFAACLLAMVAIAPVVAAGRPACCSAPPAAPVAFAHACCLPKSDTQASAPKGCCKAPAAPKPEAKAKAGAPLAVAAAAYVLGDPAVAPSDLPAVATVRLARHAHHAKTPDDSPPDRLQLIRTLLI